MNKYLIVSNWKMNTTIDEARELTLKIKEKLNKSLPIVAIGAPFTYLTTVKEIVENCDIKISAQNCHIKETGAYTGEISAPMLNSIGVDYVILGHSERREYFKETDEDINKKVLISLANNLKPIMCVGETLMERDNGKYREKIQKQIEEGLNGVKDISDVVVAYEPIWAIGTGKTATSGQAEEVCKFIRSILINLYNEVAENTFILYGGSMNKNNAEEILSQQNINGGLIGGASLKPDDFCEIINSCK